MTIKEIIQIENGNGNTIILLREGIFWRAYEKSAYAFSMQIHPYIIRKSKFPQNPKRSVRFSGKGTKRSVQKRKARNTQKTETEGL